MQNQIGSHHAAFLCWAGIHIPIEWRFHTTRPLRGTPLEIPSVIHPKRFLIKGILFEVVSYTPMQDAQAAKVVRMFYASRKFTRQDQGKVFQVRTLLDRDSLSLL